MAAAQRWTKAVGNSTWSSLGVPVLASYKDSFRLPAIVNAVATEALDLVPEDDLRGVVRS